MERITQEPEFVFYHNPIKRIHSYHLGGEVNVEEEVRACFRQLSPEEITALQPERIVYVDRQIYDDHRVWDPSDVFTVHDSNFDILQGLIRARITSRPSDLIIEYMTEGNCSGRIRTDLTRGVYDSPDLNKINDLVSRFGDGIITPPTREEGLRLKLQSSHSK